MTTSLPKKLRCLAALLLLAGAQSAAQTQAWPARTISVVVGTEAGGSPDLIARILGPRLSARLGQSVVVENRAGATGTIGAGTVARAAADGYTLYLGSVATHGTAKVIYKALAYDPSDSFAPIGQIASVPLVLVVNANSKAYTMQDLVVQARAKPGALNYGSPGAGGPQHLASELFNVKTGSSTVHIPYKSGSAAITALLAGDVDLFFAGMPPALPQIQGGKLRALAVTTAQRFPALPQVPTASEAGLPDFEVDNWHALFAPAGTPAAVVDRLNGELNAILKEPEILGQLLRIGATAKPTTPAQLGALVKSEGAKWAALAKSIDIKPN